MVNENHLKKDWMLTYNFIFFRWQEAKYNGHEHEAETLLSILDEMERLNSQKN